MDRKDIKVNLDQLAQEELKVIKELLGRKVIAAHQGRRDLLDQLLIYALGCRTLKGGGGDIKQWISRSQKHLNLEAERASKSLTELPNGRHALVFHNSRYINEDTLLLANHPGSHGFICVTFRASGDHEQTILSNFEKGKDNWREITATNTEINIYVNENGKRKRVNIHHAVHNWATLFVQHSTTTGETHGRYIINNDPKLTGSFTFDCIEAMSSGLAVGGRYDNNRFLKGDNHQLHERFNNYRYMLARIDIQQMQLTQETFDSSFRSICSVVFIRTPVSNGYIIAVLGFSEVVHKYHSSFSWYSIDILVHSLVNVLEVIDFHPEQLTPSSHCIIL